MEMINKHKHDWYSWGDTALEHGAWASCKICHIDIDATEINRRLNMYESLLETIKEGAIADSPRTKDDN